MAIIKQDTRPGVAAELLDLFYLTQNRNYEIFRKKPENPYRMAAMYEFFVNIACF